MSGKPHGVIETLEELEARLTVFHVLFEDNAFFLIQFLVNILRKPLEYLLAVVALMMFRHDLFTHYLVIL